MNACLKRVVLAASAAAFMPALWAQVPRTSTITSTDFKASSVVTLTFLKGASGQAVIKTSVRATGLLSYSATYINGEKFQMEGTNKQDLNLTVSLGAGGKPLQVADFVPPQQPIWRYDLGTNTISATLSGEYNYRLVGSTFSCKDGALPGNTPIASYKLPAGLTPVARDWEPDTVSTSFTNASTPQAGQLWACSHTDIANNQSTASTQIPVPVTLAAPAATTVAGAQVTLSGTASPNVSLLVLDSAGNELARTTVGADGNYSISYTNPTPTAASQVSLKAINEASAAVLATTDALYPKVLAVQTVNVPAPGSPASAADSYNTPANTALAIAAPGVLANDTAPAGKVLTAAVATQPANGSLAFNADGSFSYTPNANFLGSDSFTYIASYDDSKAARASTKAYPIIEAPATTVTITVTPPPRDGGGGTGTGTGSPTPAPVPGLGHTGLALLTGLLAAAAALRRRKPATANQALP